MTIGKCSTPGVVELIQRTFFQFEYVHKTVAGKKGPVFCSGKVACFLFVVVGAAFSCVYFPVCCLESGLGVLSHS